METLFNNFIDLFLHFDTYAPFERFCIIGGTVVAMASVYFAVSTALKIMVKILQFALTVAMTIICFIIIGFIVWMLINILVFGVQPV